MVPQTDRDLLPRKTEAYRERKRQQISGTETASSIYTQAQNSALQ
jgi:hypothetical protein